jgi:hypothetical protein
MAGIFDLLNDLFAGDQVGIDANRKRRQQAAYDANKGTDTSKIIDPAFIAAQQAKNGIPASGGFLDSLLGQGRPEVVGNNDPAKISPRSLDQRKADLAANPTSQPAGILEALGLRNPFTEGTRTPDMQNGGVADQIARSNPASYPLDPGIAAQPKASPSYPLDPSIKAVLENARANQAPAQAPAATGPDRQVPGGPVKPNADGIRDVDGIFPSINPADKAKYGQFPDAPKVDAQGNPFPPAPDPTKTAATNPAAKTGLGAALGSMFKDFDPAAIGMALTALDPRNGALAASIGNQMAARRQEKAAAADKKANQEGLYAYLTSQGVSDTEARMMAQNPDVAQAWWTQKQKANAPAEYGLTPQYVKMKDGTIKAVQVSKDGSGVIDAASGQKLDQSAIDGWVNPADMQGMKKTATNTSDAQFALPDVNATVGRIDEKANAIINSPDLDKVVGYDNMRPNWLSSNKAIELRGFIKELQGEQFLAIRSKLKGQGSISDFESARATAINALDNAMDASDPQVLKNAIMRFQDFAHKWGQIAEQQAGGQPVDNSTTQAAPTSQNGGTQPAPKKGVYNPKTGKIDY